MPPTWPGNRCGAGRGRRCRAGQLPGGAPSDRRAGAGAVRNDGARHHPASADRARRAKPAGAAGYFGYPGCGMRWRGASPAPRCATRTGPTRATLVGSRATQIPLIGDRLTQLQREPGFVLIRECGQGRGRRDRPASGGAGRLRARGAGAARRLHRLGRRLRRTARNGWMRSPGGPHPPRDRTSCSVDA